MVTYTKPQQRKKEESDAVYVSTCINEYVNINIFIYSSYEYDIRCIKNSLFKSYMLLI